MSAYTFIGLSYYLFPREAPAFDRHAARLVKQWGGRARPRILAALASSHPDQAYREGRCVLWPKKPRHKTILAYRYGDTVLLVGIYSPRLRDRVGIDLEAVPYKRRERWKKWFATPVDGDRVGPPYQNAFVHVVEQEGQPAAILDQVMAQPDAVRIPAGIRGSAQGTRHGDDFYWRLIGEKEYLLVSPEDNGWLHHWLFEEARLFRLLLFDGKARRYERELTRIDQLISDGGSLSRAGRASVARKRENLEVATRNFRQEWPEAGLSELKDSDLGRFFRKAHDSWTTRFPPQAEAAESSIDVGVLVASEADFAELHAQLRSPKAVKDDRTGTYDYLFTWPAGAKNPYRCAATFVGDVGPTDAALAAERFLSRRRPQTIVMLGVAAGIGDDLKLGDVIVAKSVDRYLERAKVVDGNRGAFEFRPGGDAFPCSQDLVRTAQNLRFAHISIHQQWQQAGRADLEASVPRQQKLREDRWLADEPAYVAGAIASGPVESAAETFVAWVRSKRRDYLALEMESGGVLAAVYGHADPARSLVLRGLSDFADARQPKLDAIAAGDLRRVAMRNAVRLLWGLVEAEELPRVE